METVKAETDGVHIDGVLHLQFLYVREDDQTPFGVWNGMVPFSYLLENGAANRIWKIWIVRSSSFR